MMPLEGTRWFVRQWDKSFLVFSVLALAVDPLFFYIPVVDGTKKSFDVDHKLLIVVCVLRSLVDLVSILHVIIHVNLLWHPPEFRYLLGGYRYPDPFYETRAYFFIDVIASLPLPQLAILINIHNLDGSSPFLLTNLLKLLILCQFIPRVIRLKFFYQKAIRFYSFLAEKAWAGATFNFFLYLLASHVVGSVWYLLAIESKLRCWSIACRMHNCDSKYLYRGVGRVGDFGFLNTSCPLLERNEIKDPMDFNFGIFLDALRDGMLETRVLPEKLLYCLMWGLQSLSSLGQGLKASRYYEEILFVISIAIIGLLLLGLLIGNMQSGGDERKKARSRGGHVTHAALPERLRERVRKHNHQKWKITRGMELDALIRNLPRDIRRDIKRHLCLCLFRMLPFFDNMEEHLLDIMCDLARPVFYTENSYIILEGAMVDEMVIISHGELSRTTSNDIQSKLSWGHCFGEEVIEWAFYPVSVSGEPPISISTVRATQDVQGFALVVDDLKFLASRVSPSTLKRLEHYFRFSSLKWNIWAANYIQAAWRRHCRWKEQNSRRIWAANCIQAAWRSHCQSKEPNSNA